MKHHKFIESMYFRKRSSSIGQSRRLLYVLTVSQPLNFDLQALSRAYAEHLVEQQQAEQAGLLLWRCGELASALQAFTSSSSWRNAICVAQQIPLPPDHLALLARDLAGIYSNSRQVRCGFHHAIL